MTFVRSLRKLILGETWTLPIGIAVAVGAAAIVREIAGSNGWWRHGGGFVLGAGLVVALVVAVARRP